MIKGGITEDLCKMERRFFQLYKICSWISLSNLQSRHPTDFPEMTALILMLGALSGKSRNIISSCFTHPEFNGNHTTINVKGTQPNVHLKVLAPPKENTSKNFRCFFCLEISPQSYGARGTVATFTGPWACLNPATMG